MRIGGDGIIIVLIATRSSCAGQPGLGFGIDCGKIINCAVGSPTLEVAWWSRWEVIRRQDSGSQVYGERNELLGIVGGVGGADWGWGLHIVVVFFSVESAV